jgi:hypothetical protein
VVAKPTKRPTKRKIEPKTDKVMPTGGPRQPVKRISRDEPGGTSPSSTTSSTGTPAGDEGEELTGTRARKAARAGATESAKPSRRRSKRVTEKGTTPEASARYTPPDPHREQLPSPMWVPVLMFTLWALGMLTIILNYVALVPGGETSNWYLLLGLGFILGGIITATQFR